MGQSDLPGAVVSSEVLERTPQPAQAFGIIDPDYARVVKVGPGRLTDYGTLMAPNVKVGDLVLIYPKSGHPITALGKTYWFILPGNVMAVVTGVEVPA